MPLISFMKFFKALCTWLSGRESALANYQIKICLVSYGVEEHNRKRDWNVLKRNEMIGKKQERLRTALWMVTSIPLYSHYPCLRNPPPLIT